MWDENADDVEEEGSDEISFEVYVVGEDGDPISGIEVLALFSYYSWPIGTNDSENTDEEGHAHFSSSHPGRVLEVTLYVGDVKYGPYPLNDGDGFTVDVA